MKVQIIQLEAHDDFISTRDKMGWSQTGRILLVWPPRGHILNRKLDLILLQRHSKFLGVNLAIVTSDSDAVYHSDQLGIPVFETVRQALDSPWRGKRRKIRRIQRKRPPPDLESLRILTKKSTGKWTEHPGVRIGAFILGLGAFLSILSFFIPSATLLISPNRKHQEISLTVFGSPSFSDVNFTGEIPLYRVSAIVESSEVAVTTGNTLVPMQNAIGGVRFTNLTEELIDIPEGTVVSTLGAGPVRFATTRSGELSAGIGKSIVLPTKALYPGEMGNVSADTILALEGALGLSVAVTNPMPMHDGSSKIVPSASSKDLSTLYNQLLATMEREALEEFSLDLPDGDILIEDSLVLSEIIEKTYDPPEGTPANQVELTMRLQFEMLAVREEDIHKLANLILDANLNADYLPVPETLIIRYDSPPSIQDNEILEWQITLHRDSIANIDENQAINLVLGMTTSQAGQRLRTSFDLIESPDISLIPYWWPRLPYLPFRIQISQLEPN